LRKDEEQCYHCEPSQDVTGQGKHKKVCFDCSRPSRSNSQSQYDINDPSRKALDSLLDKSSLDESEDETSSKSTEPLNEEPFDEPRLLPKKRKNLYSQQMMDSPADPPTVKKKKKVASEDINVPQSTETFISGLTEANGRSSADTDDNTGLTSTQIPAINEEVDDSEVFFGCSSPKKPKLTNERNDLLRARSQKQNEFIDSLQKAYGFFNGLQKLLKVPKVDNALMSLEDLKKMNVNKELQINDDEAVGPDQDPFVISEENLRKTYSRKRPLSQKVVNESVQSQNLLMDRYLEDQTRYAKSSQIQTADLVDALNNDSPESLDDDEISFASPSSPDRRPKNVFKVPTSPVGAINLNETNASSNWETATVKSGRFFNEGIYRETFRLPYTHQEEKAIVDFFLTEGGYQFRKGKNIWMKMESKKICPNRTWQSMKGRWEKFLSRNLGTYNLDVEDLIEADVKVFGQSKDDGIEDEADRQSLRGHRAGVKFYTEEEDLKLIHHILENRRYHDVKGREMWQALEGRYLLPGRTWQSIKERFLKVIRRKLRMNPRAYGLDPQVSARLTQSITS